MAGWPHCLTSFHYSLASFPRIVACSLYPSLPVLLALYGVETVRANLDFLLRSRGRLFHRCGAFAHHGTPALFLLTAHHAMLCSEPTGIHRPGIYQICCKTKMCLADIGVPRSLLDFLGMPETDTRLASVDVITLHAENNLGKAIPSWIKFQEKNGRQKASKTKMFMRWTSLFYRVI